MRQVEKTRSTSYRLQRMRRSIHSTANTNPPASLTPESTCYKRYMTGLMDKMSGASSG
jgi:hypothetical protein